VLVDASQLRVLVTDFNDTARRGFFLARREPLTFHNKASASGCDSSQRAGARGKVISETGTAPPLEERAVTSDLDTDLRDQTPLRAFIAPMRYRSSRLALPGGLYCQRARRAPSFIMIFACKASRATPLHAVVMPRLHHLVFKYLDGLYLPVASVILGLGDYDTVHKFD
jgi:hypothetical protein